MGGGIPAVRRVLFLAVRTACHKEGAAAEDRTEVTTLRAVRIRAAMLCVCMGERGKGTDGYRAGTAVGNMSELPALRTLRAFGGGEHLFNSWISGEEVEQGEERESVGQGQ